MTSTPFTSHRFRRCAAPTCVHGGRIRPGERVLLARHRQFVHVDDLAAAIHALAQATRPAVIVLHNVAGAFQNFAASIPRDVAYQVVDNLQHQNRGRLR